MGYNRQVKRATGQQVASKLIVFHDGEEIATMILDRERVRVGRKPHNDLNLTHSAVSGEHAVVTTARNDSFLEDLNSTNGTRLNGRLVTKKQLLHNGDEITLSPYMIRYAHDPNATVAPAGEERRLSHGRNDAVSALGQQMLTRSLAGLYPKETASTSDALPLGALRILSGPTAGKELELTRPLTTLGKPGIQVAAIARRQAGYDLVRVEGDEYPLVNDTPVDGSATVMLEHLDTVELAGVKMKFLLKRSSAPASEEAASLRRRD